MRNVKLFLLVALAMVSFCVSRFERASLAQTNLNFERDIQPIFAAHCASCHGAQKQLGQLRLDNKAAAMRVIKVGDALGSRLYQRVSKENSAHGEPQMPKGAAPLKAEQLALLKKWINEGAMWPDAASVKVESKHWAFTPPVRAALPAVKNKVWVKNAIDQFILARLEQEGLTPSPEADRVTLLRRLSLDLIGLPPTPEEVDAFLKDLSPNAYEKQVDRLLASPHYGERWGRQWLDAARYSDSDGYEKDKPRFVWFYRDWVVNALNRDLPYDQFLIQQIAGDLLPNPTQDQVVATGFLRNSMINEEGGVEPEQFRMEAMFDRMEAIGKGMLGLTIQCTQCHNHKFDPFKQEEYYRVMAFLNNSHEGATVVYTPTEQMKRADILSGTRELEARLQEIKSDWLTQMNAWEDRVNVEHPEWQPKWEAIQPTCIDITNGGAKYLPQKDGSFLQLGYAPTKHRVLFTMKSNVQNITAFRIELMNDPNLPANGPGRSILGTGALSEFEVGALPGTFKETLKVDEDAKLATYAKFASATADINLPETEIRPIYSDRSNKRRVEGPVSYAIDGKPDTAWGHDAGPYFRNLPRKAVFVLEKPLTFKPEDDGLRLYIRVNQNHGGWNSDDNQNNNLGRFRISYTTAANATADPLPANVREIITNVPRQQRSAAQVQAVFGYWRTLQPEWKAENEKIAALWKQHPEGATQLVMEERNELRPTFALKRGDFLRPDKQVEPGVFAVLNSLPKAAGKPDRLTFAQWIANREAPTTARSAVNRLWQSYFGTGLLATSEDFGKQADKPSHPELLDWLAVELMEPSVVASGQWLVASNGKANPHSEKWSMKHIHRLIVTSATYRQSSKATPALLEKDPYNRLLARASRLRVDAEIVRDIAFATSGLLNAKLGGPPVYPPAPDFLFQPPTSYGPKVWPEDKGENRYRRALYTFRFRSVPYPMLQTFDAPIGDAACVRRSRSNTPLQALTTLNETMYLEAARALAVKTLNEGGLTDAQRIAYAFRRVVARKPAPAEAQELLALLNTQRERFARGELNPWNLATENPDKAFALPKGARMEDVAAWTAVARVLLNLDEAITKE